MAEALGGLDEMYDGIGSYLLGPGGMRLATLCALQRGLISWDGSGH
jgi:hypothetical protein